MSKICGIYKITSPTGKIYIGQSLDIMRRWNVYKRLRCKSQTKLYNSFVKHGVDNHIFEIIEECAEEILLERETYWKIHYRVLEIPSLCCRLDGKYGRVSEETRLRIVESHKGIPMTDEAKDKLRVYMTPERIKNMHSYIVRGPLKQERKDKIMNSLSGRKRLNKRKDKSDSTFDNHKNRTPILQYTMDMIFICEWTGLVEAAKAVDICRTAIGNNLSGRTRSAAGYIWKYKTDI